jgi:hypothetical protein
MHQYAAARALVPDNTTESEIANNRPPSYQIVLMDPDTGRLNVLMDNATAKPRRIRFDPAPYFAAHAAAAEASREAILSPTVQP